MNDNIRNTPRDVPWRPAGPGYTISFRCDRCGKAMVGRGTPWRVVLRACAECAKETKCTTT